MPRAAMLAAAATRSEWPEARNTGGIPSVNSATFAALGRAVYPTRQGDVGAP